MSEIPTTLLSNALLVVPLALVVLVVTHFVHHPPLRWALWGLVLLKFVTPAVIPLPIDGDYFSGGGDDKRAVFAPVGPDEIPLAHKPEATAAAELLPASGSLAVLEPTAIETSLPRAARPESEPILITVDTESTSTAVELIPLETPPLLRPTAVVELAPTPITESTPLSNAVLWPAVDTTRTLWTMWAGGCLFAVLISAGRIMRFQRLLRSASPVDEETQALARSLASDLGLRRPPAIRFSGSRIPPLLWGGLTRATILLPRGLFHSLDNESRRTLLAHELAHVARRDHWTRWLELTVRCLYWWHPVAWYAGRKLREAEEQCCDARVVSLLPGSAAAYAHTILTTVDFLAADSRPIPTLATGLEPLRRSVRPLHRRLTMICESKTPPRLSWPRRVLVLGTAMLVLPFSLPADQQSPASPDEQQPSSDEETTGDSILNRLVPEPSGDQLAAADVIQESTVTVQRKFYGTDRGPSLAELLKQMQRSGIVDPLVVHIGSGHGGRWRDGKWHYTTGLTVITDADAHEAVGGFINGLNELRPAPGANRGEEKLAVQEVAYDRQWKWDTTRRLITVLEDASKAGIIRFLKTAANDDGQLVITTTKEVHEVIEPFVEFLNKRTGTRQAEVASDSPFDPTQFAQTMARNKSNPFSAAVTQIDAGSPVVSSDLASQPEPATPASAAGRRQSSSTNVYSRTENRTRNSQFGSSIGNPMNAPRSADHTKPQALTAPEDYEEITVVARQYELPIDVARALAEFLGSLESGFPVLVTSMQSRSAGGQMAEIYAVDKSRQNVKLRVIAPPAVQEALDGFLEAMKQLDDDPEGEATITLVRAEYSMPAIAAAKFTALIKAYQQSGLVIPVIVRSSETKLSLTAHKKVHEQIRKFVTFLGENWQASLKAAGPGGAMNDRVRSSLGLELSPLSDDEMVQIRPRYRGGLKVVSVEKAGPAELNGIQPGDVLVGLGRHETLSVRDVAWILDPARKVEFPLKFFLMRNGDYYFGQFGFSTLSGWLSKTQQKMSNRSQSWPDRISTSGWGLMRLESVSPVLEPRRLHPHELEVVKLLESVDLNQPPRQEMTRIIERIESIESKLSGDEAIPLELLRKTFETLQRHYDALDNVPPSADTGKTRRDVEDDLRSWGIVIPDDVPIDAYFAGFMRICAEGMARQIQPAHAEDQSSSTDRSDPMLNLAVAEAEVALAMEKLAFTKQLVEKGYQSAAALQKVESELLNAQRNLEVFKAKSTADKSQNGQPEAATDSRDPAGLNSSLGSRGADGWDLGPEFIAPVGQRSGQARLRNLQLRKQRLEEEHGTDHPEVEQLQLQIVALESQLKSQRQILDAYQRIVDSTSSAAEDWMEPLLAPVDVASVRLKKAAEFVKAAESDEKERSVLLQQAVDEYEEIYNKYRSRTAGVFARFNQALVSEKLGQSEVADKIYNELLTLPDDGGYVEQLKELVRERRGVDSPLRR